MLSEEEMLVGKSYGVDARAPWCVVILAWVGHRCD
jgi:hypothetical protein